jgi:hypothetical protein
VWRTDEQGGGVTNKKPCELWPPQPNNAFGCTSGVGIHSHALYAREHGTAHHVGRVRTAIRNSASTHRTQKHRGLHRLAQRRHFVAAARASTIDRCGLLGESAACPGTCTQRNCAGCDGSHSFSSGGFQNTDAPTFPYPQSSCGRHHQRYERSAAALARRITALALRDHAGSAGLESSVVGNPSRRATEIPFPTCNDGLPL